MRVSTAASGLTSLCLLMAAGCQPDMWNGARYKPLEESPLLPDGRSSRPRIRDTVAREDAPIVSTALEGRVIDTKPVTTLPVPLTLELLRRGQEQYAIYCSPCHGPRGIGNGMIVGRGFPAPPSYDLPRLRQAPVGYFFDVITNGYGVMYSYNDRVAPADRWAIAAYIRALQRSRHAVLADVPETQRAGLKEDADAE